MKQTHPVLRRALAAAAGLVIGLGGAVALTTPAQATFQIPKPVVVTQPDCETETGTISIPAGFETWTHKYKFQLEGQDAAGDYDLPPGDYEIKKLKKKKLRNAQWKLDKKWTLIIEPAEDCEEEEEEEKKKKLPEPTSTQGDCDDPNGTIDIPASASRITLFKFLIDGVEVERPSSHEVGPGSYEVTLVGKKSGKLYKTWVIEILTPEDCEEPEPTPEPTPEESEEPEGEGGELPVTGSQTAIAGGAALALLALGGGLFMLARRRRITFQA